jgi:O-antigen/teichoic acid export membrane protein
MSAAIGIWYYGMSARVAGALFVLVAGSTINRVGSALFQEERRFSIALGLLQIHNYTLLLAAGALVLVGKHSAVLVLGVVAVGYLLTAAWGWWYAHRTITGRRVPVPPGVMLREGLAVVGLNVAVQTLFQFERLAIPKVGDMAMLGTYAVLAAIVGSPYRMIQLGNSFTLLPRVRAASDAAAARSVIGAELAMAAAVSVVASGAIIWLAPWMFTHVLHDKYMIGSGLLAVTIAIGLVRVWEGFSTTVVAALGDARAMARMSALAWVSLAVAAGGAVIGSRNGLVGILCGVLVAWVVLAASGSALAHASYQRRFSA